MGIVPKDIVFSYRWGAETMQKLVSDLTDDQFTLQPVDAINHPAWLFGHVSIFLRPRTSRCIWASSVDGGGR